MDSWQELTSVDEIDQLVIESETKPVLIFKHSNRCSISAAAWNRVETRSKELSEEMTLKFVDVINYRNVSNGVSMKFRVPHESPQVLIIKNGICTFDDSHLAIRADVLLKKATQ